MEGSYSWGDLYLINATIVLEDRGLARRVYTYQRRENRVYW